MRRTRSDGEVSSLDDAQLDDATVPMTEAHASGVEPTGRVLANRSVPGERVRLWSRWTSQHTRATLSLMASSARVRAILDLVSGLSEVEREELRDELDANLTPDQWKSAWDEELSRRIIQIEGGEVQCATLDEVAGRVSNRE